MALRLAFDDREGLLSKWTMSVVRATHWKWPPLWYRGPYGSTWSPTSVAVPSKPGPIWWCRGRIAGILGQRVKMEIGVAWPQ